MSKADPKFSDACDEMSIGSTKGFSMLNSGELEAYYVGNQLRIKRESIDRYKERNRYIPGRRRTNAPGFKSKGGEL